MLGVVRDGLLEARDEAVAAGHVELADQGDVRGAADAVGLDEAARTQLERGLAGVRGLVFPESTPRGSRGRAPERPRVVRRAACGLIALLRPCAASSGTSIRPS